MKRIHIILILALMGPIAAFSQSNNYDFWSIATNGDTLYYKIVGTYDVSLVNPSYNNATTQWDGNSYQNHVKPSGNLTIPDSVFYSPWEIWCTVTSIEAYAFYSCTGLQSVNIPTGISVLRSHLFSGCDSLNTVNIPISIDTIEDYVFSECYSLQSVNIPENVKQIGAGCFSGCINLMSANLPNSQSVIPSKVFYMCTSLTHLYIPDSITRIETNAFNGCSSLNSIMLPNTLLRIDDSAFANCLSIPSLIFPDSLTYIGIGAFINWDRIKEVRIPDAVTYLGRYAFFSCDSLKDVYIGIGINGNSLGRGNAWPMFAQCPIKHLYYNCNVGTSQTWGAGGIHSFPLDYVQSTVGIETLELGENVGSIQRYQNGSLRKLIVNRSGTFVFSGAFPYSYSLDTVIIKSTNVIMDNSYYGTPFNGTTDIKYIEINDPTIVNLINTSKIKKAVILDSVISISSNSFSCHDSLETVCIGKNVTSIGDSAFLHCINLDSIYVISNDAPLLGNRTFAATRPNKKVIVPCNSNYDSVWGTTGFVYITGGYSLSLATNNAEWGNAAFLQNVDCSQTAIIEATPTVGHRFVQWSDGNTDNPRTITLSQNTTLTAMIEAFNVTVTTNSNDELMGSVTGGGEYSGNSEVTLTAIPACGHRFVMWNDSINVNPRTFIANSDTSFVAYFEQVFDTLIIRDTTYINIHDTTYVDVHDTTVVTDTVTLIEYVPVHDTTYIDVHDTTYVDVLVHDTTYIDVHDTTLVPVHDTTYVNVFVHDTSYVDIHDTTYIDVFVHDTTTITDTITMTEYVSVHDTTYITQIDTVTNTVIVHDTVTNTVFDTITNIVHDTTTVYETDTLWLHDTVYLHDTIYIHDTIVVGVDEVDAINAKIYTNDGQIIVDGTNGNTVWLYDINGRVLATKQDEYSHLRFDVPATGTYLVKIGNHPARKVVVIR